MDLLLDMKTLFVSLVIGHLFSAVLISAYWRHNMKDTAVRTFFYAKCVQAVAWFCLVFRDGISNALTISLANTLLLLGFSLEIAAFLIIQNTFNRSMKKIHLGLTAANIIGFNLIVLFSNEEHLRVAFVSLGIAAMLIFPAYLMVRERTSPLMKVMGYFYLIVVVILMVRGMMALSSGSTMGLYTSGVYQTVAFLSMSLVMITGNTGFVLLLKERADQELLRLASYDELTGTLNRRTFISRSQQYLTAYAKLKKPITLLLFDVDLFKMINDTYGHDTGDQVLKQLAQRIKEQINEDDLFARYGGDEFAILLPGKGETESTEFAERIRWMVDGMIIEGLSVNCAISIGVLTTVPDPYTELSILYAMCDKALYSAKNNGRNGVFRSYADKSE